MCAAVCFVCASTQKELEFLAGQITRLADQAVRLNAQLLAGTLSRAETDLLRAHFRETTEQWTAATVRRQQFQATPAFRRCEALRLLRGTPPAAILELNGSVDRLIDGAAALVGGKSQKREALSPTCRAQAHHRPQVACNTLLRVKRRKLVPTPHPRAGPEAVRAAGGGAVQALIDGPTGDTDSSEDEDTEGEAVYSSEEEDGQEGGYTTDSE